VISPRLPGHRHDRLSAYAWPAVLKFHQRAAEVRTARVQYEDGFFVGEAPGRAKPGGEHGQPPRFSPQSGVHLRAEVVSRAGNIRMVRMHADLPQEIVCSFCNARHILTFLKRNFKYSYRFCKMVAAKQRQLCFIMLCNAV
jgi:hypothetical protein